MLRGLDVRSHWRSLNPGFWPSDVPFGKRTIVYGHNGSGKSTIADLLLSLAGDGAPVDTVWDDEGGTRHRVSSGSVGPASGVAVFTKRWVEENLASFLDGKSASAIVTLGREAISAKEEEERLAAEIASLKEAKKAYSTQVNDFARKAEGVAKGVQDLIVGELGEVDRWRFTKHRYNLPTVKSDLAGFRGDVPTAADHATALMRLGEGNLEKVATVGPVPNEVVTVVGDLDSLLADTPTRQALASLDGDPQAQRWVEEGRELHEHANDCLFCGSPYTDERRAVLARHFDESWMDLRSRAISLSGRIQAEKVTLQAWVDGWPDPPSWPENSGLTTNRRWEASRRRWR